MRRDRGLPVDLQSVLLYARRVERLIIASRRNHELVILQLVRRLESLGRLCACIPLLFLDERIFCPECGTRCRHEGERSIDNVDVFGP